MTPQELSSLRDAYRTSAPTLARILRHPTYEKPIPRGGNCPACGRTDKDVVHYAVIKPRYCTGSWWRFWRRCPDGAHIHQHCIVCGHSWTTGLAGVVA